METTTFTNDKQSNFKGYITKKVYTRRVGLYKTSVNAETGSLPGISCPCKQ